jgi:NAD(P)-dependent dehydrogenase (short-subunit alcohol dehydrogenase family)
MEREQTMTVHDERFEGLRVLVTGGTRGMGEATAKRFAAAGAQVLVVCPQRAAPRFPATFIPADLSSEQGVAELGRRVLDEVEAWTS